jgi:glutaminase
MVTRDVIKKRIRTFIQMLLPQLPQADTETVSISQMNEMLATENGTRKVDFDQQSYGEDTERLGRQYFAAKFFDESLANDEGTCNGGDIAKTLEDSGFLKDDPRFKALFKALFEKEHQYKREISLDQFLVIMRQSNQGTILERAFRSQLIVPEFANFCAQLVDVFESTKAKVPFTSGAPASYISQLAKVDPKLFAMSICTVDGQRFSYGDSDVRFCIQSCVKPLVYGMALEEHGRDKVHKHVGREPSGVAFNSLCLNPQNIPHNPLINSGAIMSCSLVKPNEPICDRFEKVLNTLDSLSGGFKWGFNNSVYLSEKATADSNFCLAYMMRGKNAFPENTDIQETLDFYFQCCSMDTDASTVAVAGATIANGGVCPLTGKRIFKRQTCRDILSLMYSAGMYDYSGEWAFSIGVPAKSGVSGVIYGIIPDFGCITIYAPPLDSIGNSIRGVEFFKQLVEKFVFHNFDTILDCKTTDGTVPRFNPRRQAKEDERADKVNALYACAEGDLQELRRLLVGGVSYNTSDYDGRTLLHLAASEGNYPIVKHLLKNQFIQANAVDRWGATPLDDAVKYDHQKIAKVLTAHLERCKI